MRIRKNKHNMNDNKTACKDTENKDFAANTEQQATENGCECGQESTDTLTDKQDNDADNVSEDLTSQVAEWKDKYIRLAAEYENYRKRTSREKLELISKGGEDVIKSILAIVDDMERAIDANEKTEDINSIREGLVLIYKKLMQTMTQQGVTEIEAIGNELDTDLHEAIAKIPAFEPSQKGKIIDVVQKGYKLKDKVVRFAKVVVGE
jgi:molecular chaperone GrpE